MKSSNNSFGSLSKIKNTITRRGLFGAAFIALALAAIFWHQTSFAERNQQIVDKSNKTEAENVWQTAEKSSILNRVGNIPDDFQTLRLDKSSLASLLQTAPHESRTALKDSEMILQFPMPDGTFSRFRVQEAPVLEENMQAEFPEIKSYRVVGVDRPATTGRFDFTPLGLHATIISPDESFVILPVDANDESLYAVYNDRAQIHGHGDGAICQFKDEQHTVADKVGAIAPQVVRGDTLKTYRIAFSTTYEYSRDVGGGTLNGTVASINGWLNGLNAIFEREASIRMIGVIYNPSNPNTNTNNAIYTGVNDPYDDRNINDNPHPFPNPNDWYHVGILHNRVRNALRDKVGESNYNLGHLLTTNTVGGVAGLGIICDTNTEGSPESQGQTPLPTVGHRKGSGHSVMDAPVGNFASLKLFAHEVGHQFGAEHTQNGYGGQNNTCARSNTASYETGSGNTIMSYNGVCGADNITGGGELRFHGYSYDQITTHIINGTGATCGITTNTGNTPPTVSTSANFTIPKLTPFTLSATGSDPDVGDQIGITYAWEQFQAGGENYFQNGTSGSYTDLGNVAETTRPIFRATRATGGSSRTFPSLEYILNNANTPPNKVGGLWTAEHLSNVSRTIPFRVTARDNIGGVNNALMTVTVDATKGPFTVTNPTGTWTGGEMKIVNWGDANTNTAALAANVRILLSTDGGLSFPTTLLHNTPNNGSVSVRVPLNISTSTARIKVEAVENIFFDISGENFSIVPETTGGNCPIVTGISPKVAAPGTSVKITGVNFTNGNQVAFNNVNAPSPVVNQAGTEITVNVPTNATGGLITVTKPGGCAAAESENFTVCFGTKQEGKKDDGTTDGNAGAFPNISYHVNRITPIFYPATLSEVKIQHRTWNALPEGKEINILTAPNQGGGTNINNLNFRTLKRKINTRSDFPDWGFETYQVEPITITSGDFVIGYSFANGSNPPLPGETFYGSPVSIDSGSNFPNISYDSPDGKNFKAIVSGNVYLIRAGYYTGTCSIGKCASTIAVDDGTPNATAQTGGPDTFHLVNRITPSSYPATLTGVRLYTPFASGTKITVLSAANPSGSANINNTIFNKKENVDSAAPGSYFTYPVTPITIYSGDFVVGYSVARAAQQVHLSYDNESQFQGRSYVAGGTGTTFNLDGVNFAIRAVLFTNSCADTCTYSLTTTLQNPVPAEGAEAILDITTQEGCVWRIGRQNEWLSMLVTSGIGTATVPFNVRQNYLSQFRSGKFFIGPPSGSQSLNSLFENNLLKNDMFENNLLEGVELVVEQEAAPPTSATVSIGGRVSTSAGIGLRGAVVSLVDQTGRMRTARTNAFGYYSFEEVGVGETVVLGVTSKRHTFTSQAVTINEAVENLDFVSLE